MHSTTFTHLAGFYPYPANGNWSAAYDELFSPNILASFNSTKYDYEGYRSYFGRVNATIAVSFKVFDWKILSAVAVPNSNDEKSGLVFLTGRQGGRTARDTDIQFSNGAFAVVEDIGNGTRKIVELREASNTPSSVPNSGDDQWSCAGTLLPEFLGGI